MSLSIDSLNRAAVLTRLCQVLAKHSSRYGTKLSEAQRYVDGASPLLTWYQYDETSCANVAGQCFFEGYSDTQEATP